MMMDIKKRLDQFKIRPNGVIHVGAHWAEEHDYYKGIGIQNFVYIEPCKEAFKIMSEKVNDQNAILINVACGAEEKTDVMYVSHQNQGQSNSFLEPKLHLKQHPEIKFDDAEVVKIVTLDSLPLERGKYDLLVMDVEGYEGEVLKGAIDTIPFIKAIYTEVHRGETRIGNILIQDMDNFLLEKGFYRVSEFWPSPDWTWGDAIYVRKLYE